WYIRFRDADGRQVKRRLDPREGPWDETKAQRALGAELDRVKRERWTKPTRETFAAFAHEGRRGYLAARELQRSTRLDYTSAPDRHAIPFFGEMPLDVIGANDLDAYVAQKLRDGLAPKTVVNQLATLDVLFKVAKRWKRVAVNPLDDVDRPRVDDPET